MRIGLVSACFEPVVNGVARMVSLYRHHLEKAGHQVTVFTLGQRGQYDLDKRIIHSPALPVGKTGYHFAIRYSKIAQQQMQKMDILHCHHLLMGLEMAHRYGRCPIVFTNHTRYDMYLSAYSPLSRPAGDFVMRRLWPSVTDYADAVIAPSESLQKLLKQMGVRQPVELIRNGIELSAFHKFASLKRARKQNSSDQSIRIIYVGRLSAEKNVLALLEEFAAALRANRRLHLTLVGDGPQRSQFEQRARVLGARAHIDFKGAVNYSDVPKLLSDADIFATRSLSEVHPLTIIEAMAVGLPIVATHSPGIDDIVEDGFTGLLSPDLEGELANNLVILSSDQARLSQMGVSAFAASDHYSIENTVTQTLALYDRLLDERPDLERRRRRWHYRAWSRLSSWQQNLPPLARAMTSRGD
jgi:1,2-diacylglycerol 3-alpha-glucosyltransferase